jgi:phosphoglycolate phosphatase
MINIHTIRWLLLDFDGPVCRVFAGFPASQVAQQLRASLQDYTPHNWSADSADPHEVLRASARFGPDIAEYAHRELTAMEMQAVKSAEPTPYAVDVIQGARAAGAKVAIVSNNAESAVLAYLSAQDLMSDIDYVSARVSADPSLMKPNPHLVTQAVLNLSADPKLTALVGDQVSDVIAAHRAGVLVIGYANRTGKAEKLQAASADLVITSMAEILTH